MWSALMISTDSSWRMSAAVTTPRRSRSIRIVRGSSEWFLTTSPLRFRTRSVISSTMPGIEENSCWTPWILILVTALPSRLDRRTRLRLLPTVWPKPRSNGSTWNSPYVSVSFSRLQMTRLGSSRPRQRMRITFSSNPSTSATARGDGSGAGRRGGASQGFGPGSQLNSSRFIASQPSSTAQQLDDQLRGDRQRDVLRAGQAGDPPLRGLGADPVEPVGDGRHPLRHQVVGGELARVLAVLDLDLVAGADEIAGDVELATVDRDVPVRDHLPRLGAAGGEPQPG